ncbi:MAG: hypothetical protein IKN55_11195 [Oscillospiraceae bacterium]|nr:hypothetical protein [Oscillospiraceae bacterium]
MEEKINALLQEPDFLEDVLKAESVESVKNLFSGRGLVLAGEMIDKLADAITNALAAASGELSEDDLGTVAGGNIRPVPLISIPIIREPRFEPFICGGKWWSEHIKKGTSLA